MLMVVISVYYRVDSHTFVKQLSLAQESAELQRLTSLTEDELLEDYQLNKSKDLSYLKTVTNGCYTGTDILFPYATLKKILDLWKNELYLTLEGPKGCGKTVLCAILYQMMASSEQNTSVFLSLKSFEISRTSQYFDDFDFGLDKKDEKYIYKTIQNIAKTEKPLFVFLDLSLVQDSNLNQFSEFLSAVQELESNETVRFLLSISSGGRHPNNLDMGASNLQRYENILKKFQTVCINGFTKQQAKLCFESTNKNLTFEQVYPFTGCNPLLLCLVAKSVNLNQVTSCVSTKVENFMTWNLKLLKEGPGLVDHLMKQRLGETVQLAYMACREAPVDCQMEAKFMNSWLGKHHLAIVEDVSLETMTVLEDQDDKSATVPQGTAETKRIIRWNFPTLGTEYLDTVEHFVSNPDFKAKVNEICIKEPIFAGFWLENMFVSHYIHRTDITFDCTAAI